MKKIVSTLIISTIFCLLTCSLESVGTKRSRIAYEETQEIFVLEKLPHEILEHIITYLPRKDRNTLECTSRNFRKIIKEHDQHYKPRIRITNETLSSPQNFNALLQYLENHYITKIDLSFTGITDKALNLILQNVSHSLRKLDLRRCYNLQNPDLSNCHQLQKFDLVLLDIREDVLNLIFQNVGHSLRTLELCEYRDSQNPNFSCCQQLQELYLFLTNITDEALNQMLLNVGRNLKILYLAKCNNLQNPVFSYCLQLQILYLYECQNLQNLETIKNWAQENSVKVLW